MLHNKEITNKLDAWLAFLASDLPEDINDKLEESFHGNSDFDKMAYDKKCKEFFENDVWREHAKDSVIINYLVEIGNFVHLHYDAVDKMFYTYYDADKIYDDTETELLENLIRARNFSKSHYGVVTDKRPLYILKYGFGIRKLAGVKIYEKYDMYGSDGVLNLPKYIDYLFTISTKDFEGYDSEVYEYKFNDGNILRYKFEYKNDNEDLKKSVRQCIEKWLMPLELTSNIRSRIIDAILIGQDEISSLDSYGRFGVVSQELENEVMKKYSEESVTIGWLTGEHSCFNAQPVVLGESGTLYIKAALSKVVSGKSIKDVMKYYSPISKFEKVKVYSNILAWSRFENNFDYSFEASDYEDKDSLANYFGTCRFK